MYFYVHACRIFFLFLHLVYHCLTVPKGGDCFDVKVRILVY